MDATLCKGKESHATTNADPLSLTIAMAKRSFPAKILPAYPIIRCEPNRYLNQGIAESDEVFEIRLRAEAPWLIGFDLRAHSMVLAGGAASAMMRMKKPTHYYNDFDLFFIDRTPDGAMASIQALGEHLKRNEFRVDFYRKSHVMTFVAQTKKSATGQAQTKKSDTGRERKYVIQIVTHIYASIAELLDASDLGSTSILWDGRQVLMSHGGAFAIYNNTDIVDLKRYTKSYAHRLCKYFDRGVDIMMLGLNLDTLRKAICPEEKFSVVKLPYFIIYGVKEPCSKRINEKEPPCVIARCIEPTADYQGLYESNSIYTVADCTLRNALLLLADESKDKEKEWCIHTPLKKGSNIFRDEFSLDEDDSFVQLIWKRASTFEDSIDIGLLRRLLGIEQTKHIVNAIVEKKLTWALVARSALEVLDPHTDKIKVPFCWRRTSQIEPMSKDEWYGAYKK